MTQKTWPERYAEIERLAEAKRAAQEALNALPPDADLDAAVEASVSADAEYHHASNEVMPALLARCRALEAVADIAGQNERLFAPTRGSIGAIRRKALQDALAALDAEGGGR